MNARQLQNHIVEACRAFGLRYYEVYLIEVQFLVNAVSFTYEGRTLTIKTEK